MELICAACFINPPAAHGNAVHRAAELMVCSLGAVALPIGISGHEALRCSYCGSAVHLDHHHAAWYDT